MESLAKNSIVNLVYTVLDFLFVLLRAVYVGRILLADGVGRVSYVQSIAGYFLAFAQLGLPVYGVREIARAREKRYEMNKIFTELFVINFFSTTCALMSYFLLVMYVPVMKEQLPLFFVFGLNIFVNYFNVEWFYQGQEEYVYIAVRSTVVKLLSLIIMFTFVRTSGDYVQYALICCLEGGCNYAISIIRIRKSIKLVKKKLAFKCHIKTMMILMISTLLTTLYSWVDITMLGVLSTETTTGYYNYANTAIFSLTMACSVILSIFFPRLSYYYQRDRNKFHQLLQLGIELQMFICVPVSICVLILAPQIVTILFDKAFLPTAETIRILAILIVVQSFSYLIGYQVLMATGNEKEQIPTFFVAVIINMALNAFLIPVWANNGAAIASVISELFANVYKTYRVYRKIPFKIPWKALKEAVAGTAMMALVMLGIIHINMSPFCQCIVAMLGGTLVYVMMNLFMKNRLMMSVLVRVRYVRNEKG